MRTSRSVSILFGILLPAVGVHGGDAPRAYTVNDKAYYLSPQEADEIHPGFSIKLTSAEILADRTIRARFKLQDDKGGPLDRLGVNTPGAVSVSFIAAYIPKGQPQYVSYTTRIQVSTITGVAAIQASADTGGRFEETGLGEYVYTFGTKAPGGFDAAATHTIGAYGSRNLTEFRLGTLYDDAVIHFVPNGATPAGVRDVIRTETCNKCHHELALHGGARRSMDTCVLCHTPQTIDPDTRNTVDMPVMIHKIHMGRNLPSVQAGRRYQIIGFGQAVHDYSSVTFPADTRDCRVCHDGKGSQAANVYRANRAACGACHDDVDFATGLNHLGMPQFSDRECANCHTVRSEIEFDASVTGAHTIPRNSRELAGVVFDLLEVHDAAPGKSPTIIFSVKDKSGKPIPLAGLSRLNLRLAGPNTDYTSIVSEDPRRADGAPDGRYWWTMLTPLPRDAWGSYTIGIEGRRDATLMEGTLKQRAARDTGVNKVLAFSVDGSAAAPRRRVVTIDKCNACHNGLAFHGEARNTAENCVLCHTSSFTTGQGAAQVSIDFRTMIHKIHRGQGLARGYKIGNTDFSHAVYPGDLRRCDACHVNGSEQLPLPEGLRPVRNPQGPIDLMPAAMAACNSCHDSEGAANHAQSFVSPLGETCYQCHAPGKPFAVSKAHAR